MIKKIQRVCLLLLISFTSVKSTYAQVVINEFSCSNLSQFVDNHSDYNDWIELYNSGGSAVSLSGYYLSDDSTNNMKWQIPTGISINGFGFIRFWASGRNEVSGTSYHTNFTLKQTKNNHEWVIFANSAGVIVDAKKILQKTQLGHSYGRTINGAGSWSIFTSPTPNASNNTTTPYDAYADKPNASVAAGFYPTAQLVTLVTNEPNADMHYTTDGTLPTAASPIYIAPINIATTKVLKAITISTNPVILPSFLEFDTYFINVSHTVPVISVSGTSLDALANGNGTLVPFGAFEYFNNSQQRTAHTYGEFNRHGQDSWANSQRSLDFISRDEMGYNHSVEEVLFNSSPRDNYQRVILRAAGDDNYPADHHPQNAGSAHVRDAYVHNLALHGELNLDVRRGSKCVVYLNGNYWGVYDLRDNPDDADNTSYYYGQDKYHLYFIETWGNTWAQYGGAAALADWNNLYNYIMANNMAVPANYQYVTDRLDVTSLVDYVCANMFTVCSDWLNWNTAWWRGTDSTGTHLKWAYILWDNDATFGHYINYTGIPNTTPTALPCDPEGLDGPSDPEDHIGVLLKLRQNPVFNQYYITRQFDLWNTVFSCDKMIPELDSTVAVIDPEMTAHANRWFGTYTEWQTNVQLLRNFITQRCTSLTAGWISCYNVNGPYDITINADPQGAGAIKMNSLTHTQLPWTGTYFGNIDTKFDAISNSGFQFSNWSANSQVFNPNTNAVNVTVDLNGNDSIVAHFLVTSIPELLPIKEPIVSAFPTVTDGLVTVQYSLPEASAVSMKLFSLLGEEVTQIISPVAANSAGNHVVQINLSASHLPAGVYMLQFNTGSYSKSIKLLYAPQ